MKKFKRRPFETTSHAVKRLIAEGSGVIGPKTTTLEQTMKVLMALPEGKEKIAYRDTGAVGHFESQLIGIDGWYDLRKQLGEDMIIVGDQVAYDLSLMIEQLDRLVNGIVYAASRTPEILGEILLDSGQDVVGVKDDKLALYTSRHFYCDLDRTEISSKVIIKLTKTNDICFQAKTSSINSPETAVTYDKTRGAWEEYLSNGFIEKLNSVNDLADRLQAKKSALHNANNVERIKALQDEENARIGRIRNTL